MTTPTDLTPQSLPVEAGLLALFVVAAIVVAAERDTLRTGALALVVGVVVGLEALRASGRGRLEGVCGVGEQTADAVLERVRE